MDDHGKVAAVGSANDIFLTINGMRIPKGANHQWTSLAPGYSLRAIISMLEMAPSRLY
jgi:hypothetical protein